MRRRRRRSFGVAPFLFRLCQGVVYVCVKICKGKKIKFLCVLLHFVFLEFITTALRTYLLIFCRFSDK